MGFMARSEDMIFKIVSGVIGVGLLFMAFTDDGSYAKLGPKELFGFFLFLYGLGFCTAHF